MTEFTNSKLKMGRILLHDSYLEIARAEDMTGMSRTQIFDVLEEIRENLKVMGADLEVIELYGKEYAVASLKSATFADLSESDLLILAIFTELSRLRGQGIPEKEFFALFAEHLDSVAMLVKHGMIQRGKVTDLTDTFLLTPCGAAMVAEIVPELERLAGRSEGI